MMFDGLSAKNNTAAKKSVVKIACTTVTFPSISGSIPIVKDVAAHLGIAKNGPIVK